MGGRLDCPPVRHAPGAALAAQVPPARHFGAKSAKTAAEISLAGEML